ncbi:hypothetical protein L210DRAFT_455163 [Boletus edulis BED1]|uniref:Uncharacterized protein n=1 Tax=Boletus edulis BED1 TaxID=1328754 RepID=A0AAD4GBY2_BOLED|nr:hypothetical protein L210DRAFT_455163 [Boletus edulis BED1]
MKSWTAKNISWRRIDTTQTTVARWRFTSSGKAFKAHSYSHIRAGHCSHLSHALESMAVSYLPMVPWPGSRPELIPIPCHSDSLQDGEQIVAVVPHGLSSMHVRHARNLRKRTSLSLSRYQIESSAPYLRYQFIHPRRYFRTRFNSVRNSVRKESLERTLSL